MISILIADDHPVVRQGLRQVLSETADLVVEDEASDGQQVLDKVRQHDFDVVLLDISMPGKSGLEVLKELKRDKPGLAILVLTIFPEAQYAVRVLKAGASGYLTKESLPDELIKAIRIVSQGRKYVSSSLAEKLAFDLDLDAEKPSHETLSDREFQVMCLISAGRTVTEIAAELTLSVKTVSTYRSRILEKMGLKTSAELIHYAVSNKLVE